VGVHNPQLTVWVLTQTGAASIVETRLVQELWNGYGELLRIRLQGGSVDSVILKRVVPPPGAENTFSDRRKRRSYEVERNWYQLGAKSCDNSCRVAKCLGISAPHSLLLMEDLCHSQYHPSPSPNLYQVTAGLRWLASFHARFLGSPPPGLWEQGSYWHYETRLTEWKRMPSGPFKKHASSLDRCLKATRFKTLVHGDPKPPNFCWNEKGEAAAVDFQYVGNGCGIRDVALFLHRGLGRERCRAEEVDWLDRYFRFLQEALDQDGKKIDFSALRADWQSRFPVAWSDYARFALGWADSYSVDDYSLELLDRALTFCEAEES
jgi:phosphotransferase family enzyme